MHTYYVLAGRTAVLVHNSTCKIIPSTSADEFVVLGWKKDTKIAKDWPNHEVLALDDWDEALNDEFIRGVIEKRQKVYLASPIDGDRALTNVRGGEAVYARELNQLLDAGYDFSPDGMYMLPPVAR
ncbi:hypothetical protein ACFW2D_25060 [Streptomyces sp. NPDC058914]|uniref:hypothetical protein n=1 Tax=Streptomyces sp. NPDC058914 TaxID=3346671 RepID=UPI0036D06C2B